jgi:glutathione synthase/RimK-type ligase-like ATP-grasp enzyme
MQTGEFITDRLLPRMVRDICAARGIRTASFSDDWLIELEKDGRIARILGYKFSINNSVSAGIAQDKVAAYELLHYHDVPAVEHRLIRTKAGDTNWHGWSWSSGVVIKPLTGTSGHGVGVVYSADQAMSWMNERGIEAWAVSPLLDIRREIRVIMLDNQVLLAYEKQPVVIEGLKMFNLGKGASPKDIELLSDVALLAKKALDAIDLRLAAVDIVELPGGEYKILEINDGFMMEHYARFSPANMAKTKRLYEAVIAAAIK